MGSAAPAAPQRDIARIWRSAWRSLDEDLDDWARRLARGKPPLTASEARRLQTLIEGVQALSALDPKRAQIVAASYQKVMQAASASFQTAAAALPAHVVTVAAGQASVIPGMTMLNPDVLASIIDGRTGSMAKDFGRMTKAAQERMITDLVTSVAKGESPYTLAKQLRDSIQPTFGNAQYRSVMIARTQTARAYDMASLETFRSMPDVVKGWRWLASANSCELCQTLHGTIFESDSDTYRHPNCTCDVEPVLVGTAEARTPFGKRYDPIPGTQPSRLSLVENNGWTNWRLSP